MITISRIRLETGISDTSLLTDGLIQNFIDEETYLTQSEVGYDLQATPSTEVELTETHDGDGKTLIFLDSDSLVSVTEVLMTSTTGGITDITSSVKSYLSGMIYYELGFTKGIRNISIKFTQASDINYAIQSIITWRACIRAMMSYGSAMSEGATGEKYSTYSVSFKGMPYSTVIEKYEQKISAVLNNIGATAPDAEIV